MHLSLSVWPQAARSHSRCFVAGVCVGVLVLQLEGVKSYLSDLLGADDSSLDKQGKIIVFAQHRVGGGMGHDEDDAAPG